MALIRNKTQHFTIVAQSILRDERLSLKDIGLLVRLLSLPDNWEFSEKGLDKICSNDGLTSIRTAIKNLENCGYLKRSRMRKEDGKVAGAEWIITDSPESENPICENSICENQLQYNTKEPNTKELNTNSSFSYEDEEKPHMDSTMGNTMDDRPSFETVEAYASSNLQYLSPTNMDELVSFREQLSDDVIKYAVDESCAQGKRTWGYVRAILSTFVREGVQNAGEAKALQESFRRRKETQNSPPKPKQFYGAKVFR